MYKRQDYDSVLRYIRQYIPSREDFEQFKFEMVNGETVRFLARIRVNVDIKTGKTLFELPDFGGTRSGASGEVANDVVSRWKETLLKESENWGIVELIWGKDYSSRQGKGVIKLLEYSPFCPYTVDLEFYKEARRAFTIEEWIDAVSYTHLAQDAVNDSSINWDELFTNQTYALYEEYGSVDDFREEVNAGNLKAANVIARIYRDKGWGFFTSCRLYTSRCV